MTAVGGCCAEEPVGACACPVAPTVGPEPASLEASVLVRPSISTVQGPEIAELMPEPISAMPARMKVFVCMDSPFFGTTRAEECHSALHRSAPQLRYEARRSIRPPCSTLRFCARRPLSHRGGASVPLLQ